jgi:adenylate cyclase
MHDLPKERKTFFFTDMEGSTRIAQRLGEGYAAVLERYRSIIRSAVGHHHGQEVDTAGDGFFAVFNHPADAVAVAVAVQRAFCVENRTGSDNYHVRIGIHSGEAIRSPDGGFIGIEVHRASRVCSAAHGGQVLLSEATAQAVQRNLPAGTDLNEIGAYLLKDFDKAENLHQLIIPGVPSEFPPPRTSIQTHTIAVLPFRNTGPDEKWDNFCDGMAEEIIVVLGKVQGLHVVSRSSVFAIKNREQMNLQETARQLHATVLLTGAVRFSGRRLRVTAELVDAESGLNLWSGRYDRLMKDVFSVQDEIAANIASALRVKLVSRQVRGISSMQTTNINAYDFYLRGRRFYEQFSRQSVEFALQMFRRAIEEDDNYALAYCGLADCYSYLYLYLEDSREHLDAAQQYSMRALELDPLLAKVHVSRGIALSLDKHLVEAEASFDQAIDLDPRLYEAWYWFGRICFTEGKLEKAAHMFEKANRLSPNDYQAALLAGQVYSDLGMVEKSEAARRLGVEMAEQALDLNPGDTRALYLGANGWAALLEPEKAMLWLQRALTLEPDDAMLQYNAACVYALLGKNDEALTCLEHSVELGLSQKGWFENDSNLAPLRQEPRFKALYARLQ